MSRKSSGKKKIELWSFCEKCNSHITNKDWEFHTENCDGDILSENLRLRSYIQNGILYTKNLNIKKKSPDLSDIPTKQLNKLIFISEAAMRLCNFVIGEEILITINSTIKDDNARNTSLVGEEAIFIRLVWPLNDSFLSTVFVSEKDFDLCWKPYEGQQLKLQKLPVDPEPAEIITLKIQESDDNFVDAQFKSDLKKFLQIYLRGLVFCTKSFIACNFFNRNIKLEIISFKSHISDDTRDLETQFSQMSILSRSNIRFCKIHRESLIEIVDNLEGDSKSVEMIRNVVTKDDIGGLDEVLKSVEEAINVALGFQKVYPGMQISRGILLFGSTGCGKTMICEAIANGIQAEICRINSSEIFSKFYGETEKNLQMRFDKAFRNYPKPTLIIIEDVNNICPKQEVNEMSKRISVSFLNILDSLHLKREARKTFVLATTSDIDSLSPALRRCGRFDCELEVSVPNPSSRFEILKKNLAKIDHCLSEQQIREIANVTHGFVGSDLSNLVSKAALTSLKESHQGIEADDMFNALSQVKPSAMREISIENPNVKWEDIGGQKDLKLKLKQAIEWPLLYPEKFEKLGVKPPRGILMFGPPGCSKTMIAKALATESRLNFLSIKGPELFSMWVGESERAVREVFRKARQVAPAIIFFDEIDAIGGERSSESGSSVKERVLAQILTELDGVTALNNVTIVAATNRPDMIDKALMRPGRIDRIIYVGLPDAETRQEIFKIKLKKMPIATDVDLDELVKLTDGYSGAEIQAICQEAALKALEDCLQSDQVFWKDFEHSLRLVKPRTSPELLKLYSDYLKQS